MQQSTHYCCWPRLRYSNGFDITLNGFYFIYYLAVASNGTQCFLERLACTVRQAHAARKSFDPAYGLENKAVRCAAEA